MTSQPTVSVLMTTFNREKLLPSAIESVLASTYGDFELLVVDDHSSDGTVEVARKYERLDSRVRVIVNEKNLGDYPNRNQAARHARGVWLKYVDSDDAVYPHGLEVMMRMLAPFPEAGFGFCTMSPLSDRMFPVLLSPREAYRVHYFERIYLFSRAPLSAILRKSAWEAVGGFTSERMVSDTRMWHRLAKYYPCVLMPQGCIWYRIHNAQETTERVEAKHQWHFRYEAIVIDMLNDPEVPLTAEEKRDIAARYRRENLKRAVQRFASLHPVNALQLVRHARQIQRAPRT